MESTYKFKGAFEGRKVVGKSGRRVAFYKSKKATVNSVSMCKKRKINVRGGGIADGLALICKKRSNKRREMRQRYRAQDRVHHLLGALSKQLCNTCEPLSKATNDKCTLLARPVMMSMLLKYGSATAAKS